MKIELIIAEFESNFASSFKHTARVKYGVDFKTSSIYDIEENLERLKNKIVAGEFKDVHVGWEMTLEHVIMLQSLLNQILIKYEDVFFKSPTNEKIYTINNKLRNFEAPSAKDFAKDVVKQVFTPDKSEKLSKVERINIEAERISIERALKRHRKNNANSN